jgi:predicted RNase H-like nuclease
MKGKDLNGFVIGADGAKAGWVAARLNLQGGGLEVFISDTFRRLLDLNARMMIVDMPIGLAESGKRACEAMARERLKPLRHPSVFSSPRRPMLSFDSYEEANGWGKAQAEKGGGLSKQAWMITPKIREIDNAIRPADQHRIGEGHPEVAFSRLNSGAPCQFPKRTKEGQAERERLLKAARLEEPREHYERLKKTFGSQVSLDDVYDACVLAITAKARLAGEALHLTDGARDSRGLLMEIWG